MALIKCPECTHEVSDKALSCPNCGYRISKSTTQIIVTQLPKSNKIPIFLLVVFTVVMLFSGYILSSTSRDYEYYDTMVGLSEALEDYNDLYEYGQELSILESKRSISKISIGMCIVSICICIIIIIDNNKKNALIDKYTQIKDDLISKTTWQTEKNIV